MAKVCSSVLLRAAREAIEEATGRKHTQAAMAAKIGVTQPLISQWENGRKLPRPNDVARIAKAYKVSAIDLHFAVAEQAKTNAARREREAA